jgi:hypothetical protein
VDAAAWALDQARAAEAAGANELAASLREAVAAATASANAVDDVMLAVGTVATNADHAADQLAYLTREADLALRRPK